MSDYIFLVSSPRDKSEIAQVRQMLSLADLNVQDETTIEVGSEFEKEILAAIQSAGCIVVLLSSSAKISPEVLKQVDQALAAGKKIFPCVLSGKESSLPESIKHIQWLDLSPRLRNANVNVLITKIKAYLQAYANSKVSHTGKVSQTWAKINTWMSKNASFIITIIGLILTAVAVIIAILQLQVQIQQDNRNTPTEIVLSTPTHKRDQVVLVPTTALPTSVPPSTDTPSTNTLPPATAVPTSTPLPTFTLDPTATPLLTVSPSPTVPTATEPVPTAVPITPTVPTLTSIPTLTAMACSLPANPSGSRNADMIFILETGCKGFFIDPQLVTKGGFAVFRNNYTADDQWWIDEAGKQWKHDIEPFQPIDEDVDESFDDPYTVRGHEASAYCHWRLNSDEAQILDSGQLEIIQTDSRVEFHTDKAEWVVSENNTLTLEYGYTSLTNEELNTPIVADPANGLAYFRCILPVG